jgi:hypothetical protein
MTTFGRSSDINTMSFVPSYQAYLRTNRLLHLKRILVGRRLPLPYIHFFRVSTGICFQNWWVDAQIIGTPR